MTTEGNHFKKLLDYMRRKEEIFVFLFDNVDNLLAQRNPETDLIRFIEWMLQYCQNSKVLITCRGNDNPSPLEFSIKLEGLNNPKSEAWDLFQTHSG